MVRKKHMKDKTIIKNRCPHIFSFLHKSKMKVYYLIGRISPERLIKIWYKNIYHKEINLTSPSNIDEKINWMKLHSDLSMWIRCADKLAVRSYVEEKGLGSTLNTLLGIYNHPSDIDFTSLPEQFVLKTTNGGGGNNVLIVTDKSALYEKEVRSRLAKWMHEKISYRYYEPQYRSITPRIIAEKYLAPNEGEISLVDIKINCINGKAYSVFLCSDRKPGEAVHYSVYDLEWNIHPEKVLPEYRTDKIYPKPFSFGKMVEYSEILSEGIPFVRIDWYEVDGLPVFGEMTFTPAGGFQGFYTMEYLQEMGNLLKI